MGTRGGMEMSTKQKFKVGDRVKHAGRVWTIAFVHSFEVPGNQSYQASAIVNGRKTYRVLMDQWLRGQEPIRTSKPTRAWALKDKRGNVVDICTTSKHARICRVAGETIVRGLFVEEWK
jgi:hypothetical protein